MDQAVDDIVKRAEAASARGRRHGSDRRGDRRAAAHGEFVADLKVEAKAAER